MGRNRIRGFLLKHRVKTIFRRSFCPAITSRRLMRWIRHLRSKTKATIGGRNNTGYIRVDDQEPTLIDRAPKGSMAIYVGQKEDGCLQRIMVPVVYLNHPLFADLLKDSETEYGFHQLGALTIPCQISEFERVQTWIEAGQKL